MKQYKIKGYVAKDKDGVVFFGTNKPNWYEFMGIWCDFGENIQLPSDWFPELKYTDEPVETELLLVQPYMKKNGVTKEQVQENMHDVIVRTLDEFSKRTTYLTVKYLMALMAEELKDRSLTVESIVDKYVSTATPELRQKLIDRLNQMRQSGQVPEKV